MLLFCQPCVILIQRGGFVSVGENIRSARLRANLTQKQLGELCEIAEPTIRRYELNTLNPKFDTLEKIARALNVSVDYLMDRPNYLSPDLQQVFLELFRERVNGELLAADPSDVEAVFGTTAPFEDIFEGRFPLTLNRAEEVADELGVPLDYLIGRIGDPSEEGNTNE